MFFVLAPQVASKRILVLEYGVLQRHGFERFVTMQLLHLFLMIQPISRLLLQEPLVRVIYMDKFAEVATPTLQLNIASFLNLAVQV